MLQVLSVLSSGSGFSDSDSCYDYTGTAVGSRNCIVRGINPAHMAKNNTFSRALVTKVKTIF